MVLTDIPHFMSVNGAYAHFIWITLDGYGMMMKNSMYHRKGVIRNEYTIQFDKAVEEEMKKYEPYWKNVIEICADV